MYRILICVAVLLLGANEGFTKKHKESFVTAQAGLRMRDNPDVNATPITLVPYGEKVTILDEKKETIVLSGATGNWCTIQWNGKTGWVFGGFLSARKPRPGGEIRENDLVGRWDDVNPKNPGPGGTSPTFYRNGKCFISKSEGSYEGNWSFDKETGLLTLSVIHNDGRGSAPNDMTLKFEIEKLGNDHISFKLIEGGDSFNPLSGEYWKIGS